MGIYEKLNKIQVELKAPKGQYNSFGKYNYRSCEDILEALKPHLDKYGCVVTLADSIELIGERYYLKATATIYDAEDGDSVSGIALAREDKNRAGMSESQITGTASSYARKYALNGLFLIDDTKDADAQAPAQQTSLPKCEMCGGDITADILGDGKLYSPDQIARATKKQTGQQICSDCMRKLKGHETAS